MSKDSKKFKPKIPITLLWLCLLISSTICIGIKKSEPGSQSLQSFLETARVMEQEALVQKVKNTLLAEKKSLDSKKLYSNPNGDLFFPSRLQRYLKQLTGDDDVKQLDPSVQPEKINQKIVIKKEKNLKNTPKSGQKHKQGPVLQKILAQAFSRDLSTVSIPTFDLIKLHTEEAQSLSNQKMPLDLESRFGGFAETDSMSITSNELLDTADKLLESKKLKLKDSKKLGDAKKNGKIEHHTIKKNLFKEAEKIIEINKKNIEDRKIVP